MNTKERKERKKALEDKGFSFKYKRGNVEVGGGYEVYHEKELVGGGRETTLDEAIKFCEGLNKTQLEIRKLLLS